MLRVADRKKVMLICEGSLVMNWQVFDAVGIALGSTANLLVSTQGMPPCSCYRECFLN
jgi:hypothetical protein